MKRLFFLLIVPVLSLSQIATATAETIAASIKPIHSLVAMVLDGIDDPQLILPGSPHVSQLKPSQMRLMGNADLIFILDPKMEVAIAKPLKGRTNVVNLMDAEGLQVMDFRVNNIEIHEHHDHGEAHHDEHAHDDHGDAHHDEHAHDDHGDAHHDEHAHDDHGDAHHEEHAHDDHGDAHHEEHAHHNHDDDHHDHDDPRDFHVWLDTGNAKVLIAAIRDALIPIYPDQVEQLHANAMAASRQMDTLDDEINEILAGSKNSRFFVFHDAYQYFEMHYGLKPSLAILDHHNAAVSASRLRDLEHVLEENDITCIFSEPQFDQKIADLLAEMSGANTAIIDPIGNDIDADADHYRKMMLSIANAIASCS